MLCLGLAHFLLDFCVVFVVFLPFIIILLFEEGQYVYVWGESLSISFVVDMGWLPHGTKQGRVIFRSALLLWEWHFPIATLLWCTQTTSLLYIQSHEVRADSHSKLNVRVHTNYRKRGVSWWCWMTIDDWSIDRVAAGFYTTTRSCRYLFRKHIIHFIARLMGFIILDIPSTDRWTSQRVQHEDLRRRNHLGGIPGCHCMYLVFVICYLLRRCPALAAAAALSCFLNVKSSECLGKEKK